MGIYDNWKYRKNFDKYGTRRIRESHQSRIAEDVGAKQNEKNIKYNYNSEIFQKGREWGDSGFSLDEAPEEMKNNVSFVAGFERAQRMNLINQQLYDLGCEYFEKGILLEDTPENYKNNEYFVAGYNESNTKKK